MGLNVGCWADELQCTPADTTYSCCVKQHPTAPQSCGASTAGAEAAARGGLSGTNVVVGTLVAAATISSDDEVLPAKTQAAVEKVLRECAVKAHEAVNRKYFKGDPTPAQCAEIVERDAKGTAITTRAMQLGKQKHVEALACVSDLLSKFLSGRFSMEQRYRPNPTTRNLELVSIEQYQKLLRVNQGKGLRGTLVPDVVIHSGDPLRIQIVYDFKFPCLRRNSPTWTVYTQADHPYRDRTQGDVYEEFLGPTRRVTPWEIVR
ncbi:hypothetical protein [Melittangium boletus]|nr:hypothetical protein [Melittangium boletus]